MALYHFSTLEGWALGIGMKNPAHLLQPSSLFPSPKA